MVQDPTPTPALAPQTTSDNALFGYPQTLPSFEQTAPKGQSESFEHMRKQSRKSGERGALQISWEYLAAALSEHTGFAVVSGGISSELRHFRSCSLSEIRDETNNTNIQIMQIDETCTCKCI